MMELTPEERREIYEQEKARMEAEEKQRAERDHAASPASESTETSTGLKPNVAGLLCYAGAWITGIIFVIIEPKNRFVRFHAVQSIAVFGLLTIISAVLGWIPFAGNFFRGFLGIITFILWIVLMVKAYHGEVYKLPVAGDIAESIVPINEITRAEAGTVNEENREESPAARPAAQAVQVSDQLTKAGQKLDSYFKGTRGGRITASSFTIAWSIAWLILFTFFHGYIAYYEPVTFGGATTWIRHPLLTSQYFLWLPVVTTALLLTIAGHIILIIFDKFWLRELVLIGLNIMGIVVAASLLSIFPFNFSSLPETASVVVPVIVRVFLILLIIGMSIGTLAMFIRLVVNTAKAASE